MTNLLDTIGVTVNAEHLPPYSRKARWYVMAPRWLRWAFPGWERAYQMDVARRCMWMANETIRRTMEAVSGE